jgi:hypothetical protein
MLTRTSAHTLECTHARTRTPHTHTQTHTHTRTHAHTHTHTCVQGLEWMLRRERVGDATGHGILRLHPMWLSFVAQSGFLFYIHRCGSAGAGV